MKNTCIPEIQTTEIQTLVLNVSIISNIEIENSLNFNGDKCVVGLSVNTTRRVPHNRLIQYTGG